MTMTKTWASAADGTERGNVGWNFLPITRCKPTPFRVAVWNVSTTSLSTTSIYRRVIPVTSLVHEGDRYGGFFEQFIRLLNQGGTTGSALVPTDGCAFLLSSVSN